MVDNNIRVDNPANKPMHYGNDYIVGNLVPPDYIPPYRVYSYAEGEKMYAQMQHDIYQNSKKAKPEKKGTPLIIKILVITAALLAAAKAGSKLFHFKLF